MKTGVLLTILTVLILFVPSLGEAGWDATHHDFQNTSSTPDNGPEPPLKFLWNPEKMYIGGDWLAPIVHGDVVYLIGPVGIESNYSFTVMAVNLNDGKVLWKINSTESTAKYAFYREGKLYVDAGSMIEAINVTHGKVVWKLRASRFSNNLVYWNGRIYGEIFENESAYIVSINPQNGKILKRLEIDFNTLYKEPTSSGFIAMKSGMMYIYDRREYRVYVMAVNVENDTFLWRYGYKDYWYSFFDTSIIVGREDIYIPFIEYGNVGIRALNKTSGKVVWSKVINRAGEGSLMYYKFAYSEKYNILSRLNDKGELVAIDARNGEVLWRTNTSSENGVPVVGGTPVIANNHIYLYRIMRNYSKDDGEYVGVLQVYNINGDCVYSFELPYQATYIEGCYPAPVPDIAVSGGKVIIPDGHLYVLVNNSPPPMNLLLGGIGISAVFASMIATIWFMRRKELIPE